MLGSRYCPFSPALQLLLLSGQELEDRNNVIDLEGPQSDAQLAHALLAGQQLLQAAPSVLALSLELAAARSCPR